MKPKVELKSDLSKALESMIFAAKLCYGKENEAMSDEQQDNLIHKILAAKHFSILEHANACFYITDVSRNFTHQFVRHRHMSFAQQSFHYTVATDQSIPEYSSITGIQRTLMEKAYTSAFKCYNDLRELGMPKEEARHVLPSGIATKIVATASIREWVQFINVRTCRVNCVEIREVAQQVRMILKVHLPFLDMHMGPECYRTQTCSEGTKSCGHPWRKLI
jgi:thymidylate synthase (FAD)